METRERFVETRDQAILRLAALAEERGIRIYCYPGTGEHFATSSSTPGLLHRVTLVSCDCPGFFSHGRCTHHSALLAELGQLPPRPEPPTEAQIVQRITERVSAQSARNIESQARAWLTSLITRQDRGEVVPESHIREAVSAVALYSSIATTDQSVQLAA